MSERRFTDKPDLQPDAVRALEPTHAAMVENRTLFPTTVVTVTKDEPDRLLVSGFNNRKIGARVAKGRLRGAGIFMLSLEERATCATDCEQRGVCYGNGMQLARRHRIGDPEVFFERLEGELRTHIAKYGMILVRLHVLGDFPSAAYVEFWSEMLASYDGLNIYGYTRWRDSDKIGAAIEAVKKAYPERFRIRWSGLDYDGASVIDRTPEAAIVPEGIVCPAQTDATACCATCALCWDAPSARNIVFIKHGPTSHSALDHRLAMAATAARAPAPIEKPQPVTMLATKLRATDAETPSPAIADLRPIGKMQLPSRVAPAVIRQEPPQLRMVDPSTLLVEPAYQRDLSAASVRHIGRIVSGWDWSKFKPPVCADIGGGRLAIIDGQHTAISAACHGGIAQIPVLVTSTGLLEKRAEAFVSHNRDRLKMSQFQIFHAQVAAGDKEATRVAALLKAAGGAIPRSQPNSGYEKPGEFLPVNDTVRVCRQRDDKTALWILKVCASSGVRPISRIVLRGVEAIAIEPYFASVRAEGVARIAAALGTLTDADAKARTLGIETGKSPARALVAMIVSAMQKESAA
jgi:hypothetical protein